MSPGVHLICYADRLAGGLGGLARALNGPLRAFSGVHILPFFEPFDGPDAGFDPVDHGSVDPRLGTWDDIRALADQGLAVTADLIVNHLSARSAQFRDWLERGERSAHDGLFLRYRDVFPNGATEDQIAAFYRPRPGLPFTPYLGGDGQRRLVWTTFMPEQVDINVRHPKGVAYLRGILERFARAGVANVRIDAAGYAIKTAGTDSFMTAETLRHIADLAGVCRELGLKTLVEVHAHVSQQLAAARLVDYVYDFAAPALLLHSLRLGTVDRLVAWDAIRPRNCVTVLDTHDGIGIIDAGPADGRPGLLDQEEMAAIFAAADAATGGVSGRASVIPAWCELPHQVNSTFFDVLGRDAATYLLARAIQFFLPGLPQVYYVGLLAGGNDVRLWRETGQGRDVNRHRYTAAEFGQALGGEVVRATLGLVALRGHAAFAGDYAMRQTGPAGLELAWRDGGDQIALEADLAAKSFRITGRTGDGRRLAVGSVGDLARLAQAGQAASAGLTGARGAGGAAPAGGLGTGES